MIVDALKKDGVTPMKFIEFNGDIGVAIYIGEFNDRIMVGFKDIPPSQAGAPIEYEPTLTEFDADVVMVFTSLASLESVGKVLGTAFFELNNMINGKPSNSKLRGGDAKEGRRDVGPNES